MLSKRRNQRAVIPEGAFLARLETFPDGVALLAEIVDDGACVVQFVGGGNQPRRGRCGRKVSDVVFLPLAPGRLRGLVAIGAAGDNRPDFFAENLLDLLLAFRTAAILHRVVQQRADRLIFVRAILQRDRGHPEQMPDVWDLRFFTHLPP